MQRRQNIGGGDCAPIIKNRRRPHKLTAAARRAGAGL